MGCRGFAATPAEVGLRATGLGLFAAAAFAGVALGAVGSLTAVEGEATLTSSSKAPVVAKAGAAVEVGDVLRVKKGALKLTLNDTSVVLLAQGSDLEITEADFAGQERRSFSARLGLGTLWAKVAKALAGSGAKFEIETERAVAGVRGTTFQVEVTEKSGVRETHVGVIEGSVGVAQRVAQPAVATSTPPAKPGGGHAVPAAVPALVPAVTTISAGQGLTVGISGMSQTAVGSVPMSFDRLIRDSAGVDRDDTRTDDRHDDARDRRRDH
jgi:hypothetical protein